MHLLVAFDDSDPARAALEHALEEHPDAEITAAHVVDLGESGYGEVAHLGPEKLRERRREAAMDLLEGAHDRAAAFGRDLETDVLEGSPAEAVVDYAEEHDVDRIVVGSHGRTGVSRVLLGSVAERIARRGTVPVTIVR